MATTLYFAANTASRKEAGTYPVAATNYANVTPTSTTNTEGFMLPCAGRTGAVSNIEVSSGTGTTAKISRFGRFFSAPFAENYTYTAPTTTGNATQFFMADWESNLSANHCIQQCFIYVWRPSTGAIVGTIQPVQTLATGSKEPTAANSIQSTLGSYYAASSGVVNIQAGDILVFEPFSTYTKGASTSYNLRFYYGGPTAITAENTVVATPASRVVFAADLPLLPPIGVVSSFLGFSASITLLGPRFASSLVAKSRLQVSTLTDGSLLTSRLKARATVSSALTTQVLLSSSLKSISKWTAWIQQSHALAATLSASAKSFASFPNPTAIDTLTLFYSGGIGNQNPGSSLGGARGGVLQDMQFSTTGNLPGVEILAAHGMLPGTYRVKVNGATRRVALVLVEGLPEFSTTLTMGTSVVSVGSELSGFVVLRVTPHPAVVGTVEVSVTDTTDTLFYAPSTEDRTSGATHYRSLYLYNDTDSDARNITVSVSYASESTFSLGTEYPYSDNTDPRGAAALPTSVKRRALDVTGWGGTFVFEQPRKPIVTIGGLPTIVGTALPESWTDGVTRMLPSILGNQSDISGLLAGVSFGPSIFWGKLPARKGVTFWVRRVTPAGALSVPKSRLPILINADV